MTTQKQFIEKTGYPFDESNGNQYILDTAIDFKETGCKLTASEFDSLSIKIANFIDSKLDSLGHSSEELLDLGYPSELISTIIPSLDSNLAYMRLSYVVDISGLPKLIEINSQTPSFNFELEAGTNVLLNILRLPIKNTVTEVNLIACFKDNLETLAKSLGKDLANCRVALLTCDSEEDVFQMNYIKQVISPITKNCDVLTTKTLDFNQHNQVFNSSTQVKYDILFNWFPLELSILYPYPDGSYFHTLLAKSIETKQIAVFNGKSFLAQNKYFLCWLQEQGIPADLQDYWTPSFYTEQEITAEDWIAKPIWGRQGAGIFGKQTILGKEKDFSGDLSDDYFNSQYYIYQQMWTSYPVIYNNEAYKTTLEKFVYKTKGGWQNGGCGLRISHSNIANNESSWLAIK